MNTANVSTCVVEHDDVICVKSLVLNVCDPSGLEAQVAVAIRRAVEQTMERLGAQRASDGVMVLEKCRARQSLRQEKT